MSTDQYIIVGFVLISGFLFGIIIFAMCRPMTIYDKGRKSGKYVVISRWTGNYAFHGELFNSTDQAVRRIYKLTGYYELDSSMFEIRRID